METFTPVGFVDTEYPRYQELLSALYIKNIPDITEEKQDDHWYITNPKKHVNAEMILKAQIISTGDGTFQTFDAFLNNPHREKLCCMHKRDLNNHFHKQGVKGFYYQEAVKRDTGKTHDLPDL